MSRLLVVHHSPTRSMASLTDAVLAPFRRGFTTLVLADATPGSSAVPESDEVARDQVAGEPLGQTFDAMFADGNQQLLATLDALDLPADPRAALKLYLGTFASFAVADPARNSLLFRRVIPGFEPSPESYAVAQQALAQIVGVMNAAGVTLVVGDITVSGS